MKAILRKLIRPAPLLWNYGVAFLNKSYTGHDIVTLGGSIEHTVVDLNGEPKDWLDPVWFSSTAIPQGALFWFGYFPAAPTDKFLMGLNNNDVGDEGVHFHQSLSGEIRGRVVRANVNTADLSIGTPIDENQPIGLGISWDGVNVAVYMNGEKKGTVAAAGAQTFNRLGINGWISSDPRFTGEMKALAVFNRKPTDFESVSLTKDPIRFF